jgi:hypothetical protein
MDFQFLSFVRFLILTEIKKNINIFFYYSIDGLFSQAFVRVFAPFGASGIKPGITDLVFTFGAGPHGFIFPEFDLCPAARANHIENIFGFPVSLILARASRSSHDSSFFI